MLMRRVAILAVLVAVVGAQDPRADGRQLMGWFRRWKRHGNGRAEEPESAVRVEQEVAARPAPSVPRGSTLCTDTCPSARNGRCEDGGDLGSASRVAR
eukprot:5335821-Prymnesium_polylepis.1